MNYGTKNEPDDALNIGGSVDWLYVDKAACTAQAAAQGRSDDGSYLLGDDDVNVQVCVPATGSIHVKLPPVQRVKGREYNVVCVKDDGGTGVVVEDLDDAFVSGKNYVTAGSGLTAVGDEVRVKSLGVWYSQTTDITT